MHAEPTNEEKPVREGRRLTVVVVSAAILVVGAAAAFLQTGSLRAGGSEQEKQPEPARVDKRKALSEQIEREKNRKKLPDRYPPVEDGAKRQ